MIWFILRRFSIKIMMQKGFDTSSGLKRNNTHGRVGEESRGQRGANCNWSKELLLRCTMAEVRFKRETRS